MDPGFKRRQTPECMLLANLKANIEPLPSVKHCAMCLGSPASFSAFPNLMEYILFYFLLWVRRLRLRRWAWPGRDGGVGVWNLTSWTSQALLFPWSPLCGIPESSHSSPSACISQQCCSEHTGPLSRRPLRNNMKGQWRFKHSAARMSSFFNF